MKGHKEEKCWQRRDRSESKERGDDTKRQRKQKSPKRGVKKIRESEIETDRESSAPSDSKSEATPNVEERTRSRKVGRKPIMKTPVRRIKPSDVIKNETLTLSASFSKN